jgi:3-hydroxyisobutyrate dehydrogenase
MALRTGFVGLGNIGRPMARRRIAAGLETSVPDALREPVDERVRDGARLAGSPGDFAAGCDGIGVCERDDADVRALVGDEGRR